LTRVIRGLVDIATHWQYDSYALKQYRKQQYRKRKIESMDIKPIRTKADYKTALKAVETLMGARADSPDGDRLGVLVTLIEAYERIHYPMDFPDPVEAIKFAMEQKGLAAKDLEPMIGRTSRVYEVLNHKRSLTLKMIWRLHRQLGIPAESLLRQPEDLATV
jgi:HTH-type transcriptional regulator/antitoxin HigA